MISGESLSELSDAEFRATFAEPVVPLAVDAERQRAIEDAASAVLARRSSKSAPGDLTLQDSYELGSGGCVHHLVWYGVPNVYLVFVADAQELRGFHRLDLNGEYGLAPAADPFWFVQ